MNDKLLLSITIPTATIQKGTLANIYQQINTAAEKYGLVYSWQITDVEITGDIYTLDLIPHQIPTKIGESGNLFDIEAQHNLFSACIIGNDQKIDSLNKEIRNKIRVSNNNLINTGAMISSNSESALEPKEIPKKIDTTKCDVRIEALVEKLAFLPGGFIQAKVNSITGLPKKNNNKKILTLMPPQDFIEILEEKRERDNNRIEGTVLKGSDLSKNEVIIDEKTAIILSIHEAMSLLLAINSYHKNIEVGTITPELIQDLISTLKKFI